jgi:hypothetical protein
MTQILNLTLLAPDLQEQLLFLDSVEEGKPEISEKRLRRIGASVDWDQQRELQRGQRVGDLGLSTVQSGVPANCGQPKPFVS